MECQLILNMCLLKVVLVCDWTDEIISPKCCSALKSEIIVGLFHVKPHCLFILLWLINVASEQEIILCLIHIFAVWVYYKDTSEWSRRDWGLWCRVCHSSVCSSVNSGSLELLADGLLWHLLHSLLTNVATTTTLCPPKILLVSSRGQTAH